MANEKHEDKMDVKKPVPVAAEPKLPAPTAEEVNKALEEMVVKAEAAGMRDDTTVANARSLLDRQPKKEEKNATHKG
jgi:hypothetical protein